MPRSRHRFGKDHRRRANLLTILVVAAVLVVGVWLLVRSADFGDDAPRSAVN